MQKRTFSWLLLAVAFVGGVLVYRYTLKPLMQRKALEVALDESSQELDTQKEEILQEVSALLSKMEELGADKAVLRDQAEALSKDIDQDAK